MPEDDNGKRWGRHQRRRALWRQRQAARQLHPHLSHGPIHRPMWQEPLRGALYAAGGSAITLLTAWLQHWIW
ncbi:hypothetical protein [Streptomyces sp. NPDC059008]